MEINISNNRPMQWHYSGSGFTSPRTNDANRFPIEAQRAAEAEAEKLGEADMGEEQGEAMDGEIGEGEGGAGPIGTGKVPPLVRSRSRREWEEDEPADESLDSTSANVDALAEAEVQNLQEVRHLYPSEQPPSRTGYTELSLLHGSIRHTGPQDGTEQPRRPLLHGKKLSKEPYKIPDPASWFDMETVSEFEMRMLPEFFTGRSTAKTAEFYQDARNTIVKMWQECSQKGKREGKEAYLTATDCRKRIPGDVGSILRIHELLDNFGIINCDTDDTLSRAPRYPMPPPPTELWQWGPDDKEGEEREIPKGNAARAENWTQFIWGKEDRVNLIRYAGETEGDWQAVAARVGSNITAAECLEEFMSLSVGQIFADEDEEDSQESEDENTPEAVKTEGEPTEPQQQPVVEEKQHEIKSKKRKRSADKQESVGRALEDALAPLLKPLAARQAPALLLAQTLAKNCHPDILAAALSAALAEMRKQTTNTGQAYLNQLSEEPEAPPASPTSQTHTSQTHTAAEKQPEQHVAEGARASEEVPNSEKKRKQDSIDVDVMSGGASDVANSDSGENVTRKRARVDDESTSNKSQKTESVVESGSAGYAMEIDTGDSETPAAQSGNHVDAEKDINGAVKAKSEAVAIDVDQSEAAEDKEKDALANGEDSAASKPGIEKSTGDVEGGQEPVPPRPPPLAVTGRGRSRILRDTNAMGAAAAATLSVMALQAGALKQDEHTERQLLINDLVETRLQTLEANRRYFDEMEALLAVEQEDIACDRAELFALQARTMLIPKAVTQPKRVGPNGES